MNFAFAELINPDLEQLNFNKALQIAETELKKLPAIAFHDVIGKPLTDQADDLATWIEDFFQKASGEVDIKALYFEINEFAINTELWYIDCFAYSADGGLDLDDMEWLYDFEADSQSITETVFPIKGYETLQNAFETLDTETDDSQNARDWSEQIIIARFMELMRNAHLVARQQQMQWAVMPIYFTEHTYDFIVRSEVK